MMTEAKDNAMWIAQATHWANNQPEQPKRDTQANRFRPRKLAPLAPRPTRVGTLRPDQLGGHTLERTSKGWRCTTCRRQVIEWKTIAPRACDGEAVVRWAKQHKDFDSVCSIDLGHNRVLSGDILWCTVCGSYAESRAVDLPRCAGGGAQPWRQHRPHRESTQA